MVASFETSQKAIINLRSKGSMRRRRTEKPKSRWVYEVFASFFKKYKEQRVLHKLARSTLVFLQEHNIHFHDELIVIAF
jgi:hypothetical protein